MATNLEYIYRLRDQYSKQLQKITKSQKDFEAVYKKSMGKVNAALCHNIRKVKEQCKTYRQSGGEIRKTIGRNNAAVIHSTQEIRKQGAEHLKTMRRARQSARSVADLAKRTGAYSRQAENLRRSAHHWNRNAQAIDRARRAQTKFNKTSLKGMGQKGREIAGKGAITAATGLGLLYTIKKPTDVAVSYELAFKDVKKSVDGTDEELMTLRNKMKEFRGAAFEDLAAIASDVGKMGIRANKNMEVTSLIAQGAQALDFLPEEAVEQVGKILSMTNQMDKPVKATKKIIDSVTHLENSLEAVKARDILNVWRRVSGVMADLKFDHHQMAGMSAALVQLGVAPELAASGFKSMIRQFKKTDIGRSFLKKLREEGPQGLKKIMAKMATMSEQEVLKISGAFGEELVTKLLKGQNLDKIFKSIELSKVSVGAMDREWALFMSTQDQRRRDFVKSFKNMMDEVGKPIKKIERAVMDFLEPIFKKIGEFIDKNRKLATSIIVVIGVIGSLMVLFGALTMALGGVLMAFGGFIVTSIFVAKAAKILFAILKFGAFIVKGVAIAFKFLTMAIISNPIVLIIGAIIAVIAGLVTVVIIAKKKLGSWGEAFKFLGQLLLKAMLDPINIVILAIGKLLKAASYLPGQVGSKAAAAADKLSKIQDTINVKLTGNKSLTAYGMMQDLRKSENMDSYKQIATGNINQAVEARRREEISTKAFVDGRIKVEAEPGTKVKEEKFGFFNLGNNLAYAQ